MLNYILHGSEDPFFNDFYGKFVDFYIQCYGEKSKYKGGARAHDTGTAGGEAKQPLQRGADNAVRERTTHRLHGGVC